MSKKKILHIIIGLNVGGAELMLQRLVLNSSKKGGFEHCVISLTDLGVIGPKLKEQGIKVYSLGMNSLSSLPLTLLKLRRLMKKIDPDVVQTWMYHADFIGGLAAKSLGIKNIIWGIRTTDIEKSASKLTTYLSKVCANLSHVIPTTIVCVAEKAKEYHINIGYDKKKFKVIPNGFDLSKFHFNSSLRSSMRKKLNITTDELVIGHIGRFNPVKNQINFIEACINLLEKGFKFKIIMAGRNINLDNPQIYSALKDNKYKEHFIFLEEVKNPLSFYCTIDIFCLCSYSEGFPNVLGEAMACENVCLSTDAGDASLIMEPFGFHIKSPSTVDIAEAIESNIFLSTDIDFETIGKNNRKKIDQYYSIDSVVRKFESLY